jgi:hypothetical protein
LAEQIKHSVTFNAYIGELEQAVLTKNQTKKAESIKYFKEHSDLKSTLEQNVQKLASSSKESYDKLELLQIQLYGYLFLDEGIAIDGNKGVQTNLVIEALQENENMNLEALTKKITRILQRYSKSSIRKNVI